WAWNLAFQVQCSLNCIYSTQPDLLKSFDKLRQRIEKANTKRNNLVHSFWGRGDTADTTTRYKRNTKGKAGFKLEEETLTADEIKSIAALIGQVNNDVYSFFTDLMET
ncbi:MAG: hypothetical protein O7E52_16010, partial [Candidatus Poribacteria bacterium]|nr:hypothetical protein [Candidatus Poribacteria bacterium]